MSLASSFRSQRCCIIFVWKRTMIHERKKSQRTPLLLSWSISLSPRRTPNPGVIIAFHVPDAACRVANLFFALPSCEATRGAMMIGLRDMRESKRRSTIAALISRADANNLETVAKSVDFFLKGVTHLTEDPRLRREIEEENFMAAYASALHSLLKKAETYGGSACAFWDTLAGSVAGLVTGSRSAISLATNPVSVLPKLVDAGLFTCAAACLPHQAVRSHKSVTLFLQGIQPYLYLSKVCIPANDRGDLKAWWDTTPSHVEIQGSEAILRVVEFYTCMQLSNHTFVDRGERQVNLCSNLWVGLFRDCNLEVSLTSFRSPARLFPAVRSRRFTEDVFAVAQCYILLSGMPGRRLGRGPFSRVPWPGGKL